MIPTAFISNASAKTVQQTAHSLPNVHATITGWFQHLILVRVLKTIVDRRVQEATEEVRCMGAIQPFGPRELKVKPEGERAWNWQMLHTTPNVNLKNDEIFRIEGADFRVMSKQDYSRYGYVTYELLEGYDGRAH